MSIRSEALWPTMFHLADFADAAQVKPKLVEVCRSLEREGRSWGIAQRSKHGLFESPPALFERPETRELVEFCGGVISKLFRRDVFFAESWCHVTNGGGYHDAHAHPDFARGICGIYYVQCGECTGEPVNGINRFYSPNVFDDNDVADIVPVEGRLLLFPGYVRHAALPYSGKEDRIVISFNAAFGPQR